MKQSFGGRPMGTTFENPDDEPKTQAFAPRKSPYLQDAQFHALRAGYDEAKKLSLRAAGASAALGDVLKEQQRQVEKWGVQNHEDGTGQHSFDSEMSEAFKYANDRLVGSGLETWRSILLEEVFEAMESEGAHLREELVQVAAVALSWVEAIDRRTDV